jgi:hypothetical protein
MAKPSSPSETQTWSSGTRADVYSPRSCDAYKPGQGPKFIIRDRDEKFGAVFDRVTTGAGIRVLGGLHNDYRAAA